MRQTGREGKVVVVAVVVVAFFMLAIGAVAVMGLVFIRSAARRVQCLDNLRGQAIAAHTFHDSYKRLPAGTLGHADAISQVEWRSDESPHSWSRCQFTSAFGLTMPFREMSADYDQMDPMGFDMFKFLDEFSPATSNFVSIPGAQAVAAVHEPGQICPSAPHAKNAEVILAVQSVLEPEEEIDDYAVLMAEEIAPGWNSKDIAPTNYLSNAGAVSGGRYGNSELADWSGPMTFRSRMTLDLISYNDGVSSTIMFGESIGGINQGVPKRRQGWLFGAIGRGRGSVRWGDNDTAPLGNSRNSSEFGFGSAHPGVVNFSMCDASTNSISHKIAPNVFYALCGQHDGFDLSLADF